jgi:large-conductance mechanosensitive channel
MEIALFLMLALVLPFLIIKIADELEYRKNKKRIWKGELDE